MKQQLSALNKREILADVERMLAAPSVTDVLNQFGTVERVGKAYQVRVATAKRLCFDELNNQCDKIEAALAVHGIAAYAAGGAFFDDCVYLNFYESEVKR